MGTMKLMNYKQFRIHVPDVDGSLTKVFACGFAEVLCLLW
jgi:hypothetical protein